MISIWNVGVYNERYKITRKLYTEDIQLCSFKAGPVLMVTMKISTPMWKVKLQKQKKKKMVPTCPHANNKN